MERNGNSMLVLTYTRMSYRFTGILSTFFCGVLLSSGQIHNSSSTSSEAKVSIVILARVMVAISLLSTEINGNNDDSIGWGRGS